MHRLHGSLFRFFGFAVYKIQAAKYMMSSNLQPILLPILSPILRAVVAPPFFCMCPYWS